LKKLGEILVEQGLISREQLEDVLERQIKTGGRLGTNLVELLHMDDAKLGAVLAQQLGVPSIHPKVLDNIEPEVLDALSAGQVEEFRVFPFKKQGKRLHVAMIDPTQIDIIDDLSHRTGYIIRPYICSESVIYRAMLLHYKIPPPVRRQDDDPALDEGEIIYSQQNLISLEDGGQFTLVDRTDLLGKRTKTLFLDATSKTLIIGYFLQNLSYICDKIAFLAYDQDKNYLWQDARTFQEGKKGIACGVQVNRSPFWKRYLSRPGFFYSRVDRDGSELDWLPKMLDLDSAKAFFLGPLSISKKVLGIAIGGSSTALRLEEELDTIKKLHMIAVCALKIQTYKKMIEDL